MSAATASARPIVADEAAIRGYLETLYGTADGGHLPLWTLPDKKTEWVTAPDLNAAADAAKRLADRGLDVYHGIGLHPTPLGPHSRGAAAGVCAIPGLYMDIDISHPNPKVHAETALPRDVGDVGELLSGFPLRPTLLIDSGHGVYVHWLMREVLAFADARERNHAADVLARLQREIRRRASERGWRLDTTSDLARVLRPAGVQNRKAAPVLTRILHDSGERYTLEEIEDRLPEREDSRRAAGSDDANRPALAPIFAGCAFVAHCRDDAKALTEPEWHAGLSIVSLCDDGERQAHAISEDYPRYSEPETQQKFERARAADRPYKCATIEDRFGDDWCAGCRHRGAITSPIELGRARTHTPGRNGKTPHADAGHGKSQRRELPLNDFVAFLESHKYIHIPTGKQWPRASVNAAVKPIFSGIDEEGNPVFIPASHWLDEHEPVHQVIWSPGDPKIIDGRLLNQGGWIERDDLRAFNLYLPPTIAPGDPAKAGPWIEHVRWLYPNDFDHITRWLAHRVQRPAEKINHGLLLGSPQGCGKDSLLKPVREAVGPWNYADASPSQVMGRFNGFLKSVILLVPELCDLGDLDRYKFYEHMKPLLAAPPTTLRCDEKFLAEIAVLNVCGVIFTSNQRIGIFLPAGDRRHYAAWSDADPATLPAGYFDRLHRWLDHEGGSAHVAAYLHAVDLSGFNPTAPPPKTEWFWSIVDSGRAPEESELSTLLDWMAGDPGGGGYPNEGAWPDAVTLAELISEERRRCGCAPTDAYVQSEGRISDFASWLEDRKNRRQIPHRMEAVGYVAVRNDAAKDGLWSVNGVRMAIYARQEMTRRDQIIAASKIAAGGV